MAVLDQEYYTTDDLAVRYRTVPSVIRYWRHTGTGPKGALVGKRVLYPRGEVEKFDRELRERAKAGAGAA